MTTTEWAKHYDTIMPRPPGKPRLRWRRGWKVNGVSVNGWYARPAGVAWGKAVLVSEDNLWIEEEPGLHELAKMPAELFA